MFRFLAYNLLSAPACWPLVHSGAVRREIGLHPGSWIMDVSTPVQEKAVRVGPMVNLEGLVRSLGHDPLPIFEEFGVNPEIYKDPDHRMPFLRSSRLLARCVEVTGIEHFGLLLGQKAEPSHLGLPGFLAHAAPNVEQALKTLIDTLDLHDEGGTASLDIGSKYSSVSYSVHLDGAEALDTINDLAAVMLYKIMTLLCGPEFVGASVKLQRREPANRSPWRRYFHTAVYFDSTACAITFSNQCLAKEPPTADALLFRHLLQEAKVLHELQHGELMDLLPAVLRRCLLEGRYSVPEVAEALGLHERTLHRRLSKSGTSFRHELDSVRRVLSEQLLQNTGLKISDIATIIGYADASGFIRAFERWCGISPNAWRKKGGAV